MKEVLSDIVICGAGPAGLTAAIYARRACLETIVIDKQMSGGQMLTTTEIANYPGVPETDGTSLSMKMDEHAKSLGAEFINEEITAFDFTKGALTVTTSDTVVKAKAVILAMGASRRTLAVDGEERLIGRGVSYCATCDGFFFRGKNVAVVGGGNSALEEAIYLSQICKEVTLIHRRDEFRGVKHLEEQVRKNEKIKLLLNSKVEKIDGENKVEKIVVNTSGTSSEYPIDAVFVSVGTIPVNALLKDLITLTASGHVNAGEDTKTNIEGVFAAGDLRQKPLYQIITAASDGAIAATMAHAFIHGQ